ncbi:b(0,+)-type amino acid transporter 1 [Armadillidium vulgare]|nr:b(0,+)-type amino acid transporter 1 [Armadillidium vulgare]
MGGSFTAVRIAYAAAREGHLPDILSFLNIRHFTPTVAYLLNCFLSLLLIVNSSILGLIFLAGLLDSFFMGLAVALVFVFRITRKNEDRIKSIFLSNILNEYVNLVAPAISFLFYVFLVVTPFIEKPKLEYSYVLVILFSGFVFYVPFVYFGLRWRFLDVVKEKLQIFLEVSPPEDEEIR